jgi:acyl-homoserine-lactone acylase
MKSWIKGAGAVLLTTALGLTLWEPLTAPSGRAPVPLTHDARIVRDKFGVPHIKGKTDADASFGLAWAHAEDDFRTIQEVLAMTRGRAGTLLGADGAKIDYVYHLMGARDTAERRYREIPADVRAVAEGYARGLNLYAARHSQEVRLSGLFPVNGTDVVTGCARRFSTSSTRRSVRWFPIWSHPPVRCHPLIRA